jgi:hypothetical protein
MRLLTLCEPTRNWSLSRHLVTIAGSIPSILHLRMKRILQPIAVVIIALVAMQPAVVGLLCRAPLAPCPLAFTDSTPHCGALSKADLDGSRPTTRVHSTRRSMASVALPATRKAPALAAPDGASEALPAASILFFVPAAIANRSESPPIYLRNRVFRI